MKSENRRNFGTKQAMEKYLKDAKVNIENEHIVILRRPNFYNLYLTLF